jgi:DNA-binding response OmpR family regulator
MSTTIAIAEDEEHLREVLVEYLTDAGFEVLAAPNGPAFRAMVSERPIDVAVLDLIMPGEDGLSLTRWLRTRGPVGIIIATAQGRPIDRIVGLEIGADDYIVKPYELRELLARIRSILRRAAPAAPAPMAEAAGKSFRFGPFRLDASRRDLKDDKGETIALTPAEFDLLLALVSRPGRILSRQQLAELCGGEQEGETDRAIDVRMARLRRKVEENPEAPRYLRTARGQGYVFAS